MIGERERQFRWTADSILWYRNGADYGNYFDVLAGKIRSAVGENKTVCDMCCGIGALTLRLASFSRSVLAADINSAAIETLKEDARRQNIQNIDAVVADFIALPPPEKPFNALVLCFFSRVDQCYDLARPYFDEKLIFIANATKRRAFSASSEKNLNDERDHSVQFLENNKIPYTLETLSLEFGQPLTDLAEAKRFIRHYDQKSSDTEIDRFLVQRLIPLENNRFSWYLPNRKEVALLIIEPSK